MIKRTASAIVLATLLSAPLLSAQTAVTSTTSTTTSEGMVSEMGPDALVVRSETSSSPVRYSFSESTTYVDETGAPVSREVVHSGVPVTVHYVQQGDRMIANRVVVRRQTTTTTQSAPAVIERVVEKPVIVEKPVVVEKRVPVVVEKPAPEPSHVVTEETTTTTTTHND